MNLTVAQNAITIAHRIVRERERKREVERSNADVRVHKWKREQDGEKRREKIRQY